MAYLDVYYGRIGSYNGAIKVDNSALANTVIFSSTGNRQYTSHNFIKPVGLFQHMGNNQYNVFVFGVVQNSSANCLQWYQNYSGHPISYGRVVGGFTLATIQSQYISGINFFNVIPWFNNIDDASNWSCGNSFNPANWVGGLDVRVQYNWQSVPSINGKNGILSLAQIKDEYINEGESVSGASSDHFTNLSTENRVDVLIDSALPDPETGGTTVTVEYTIPSLSIGSYAYCKLVAKKNSIPESVEDGNKIIDIDPSLVSAVIRGLDELSTYYFVIFVEDNQGNTASSEPKSCETGEINELTLEQIAKSIDSSHMQTFISDDPESIESEYIGTDWWLCIKQTNGLPCYYSDGHIYADSPNIYAYIGASTLIPLNRHKISSIKLDIIASAVQTHMVQINLYSIENNKIKFLKKIFEQDGHFNYDDLILDCENMNVDYLGIHHGRFDFTSRGLDISNIIFYV